MNEWKELQIDNLPPDILTDRYERQSYDEWCNKWGDSDPHKLLSTVRYRYRRKQKPAPTHEEIMTKWWRGKSIWSKVESYNPYMERYSINIGSGADWHSSSWFSGRESADIPPEE